MFIEQLPKDDAMPRSLRLYGNTMEFLQMMKKAQHACNVSSTASDKSERDLPPKPSPADGPDQQTERGPTFCTVDVDADMEISTVQEVVQMVTTCQCFSLDSVDQPSASEVIKANMDTEIRDPLLNQQFDPRRSSSGRQEAGGPSGDTELTRASTCCRSARLPRKPSPARALLSAMGAEQKHGRYHFGFCTDFTEKYTDFLPTRSREDR
eukprot:superscaffoldBa00007693_g22753